METHARQVDTARKTMPPSPPHDLIAVMTAIYNDDDSALYTLTNGYAQLSWCVVLALAHSSAKDCLRAVVRCRKGDAALWHDALVVRVITESAFCGMVRIASAHSRTYKLEHLLDMIDERTDIYEVTKNRLRASLV